MRLHGILSRDDFPLDLKTATIMEYITPFLYLLNTMAPYLLLGFLLTFVPVVLLGVFALRVLRIDFGSVSGMLCGSMANPMALTYANDTIEGDNPSVSYATVYPLCMFLRVVIIQVMLMIFL